MFYSNNVIYRNTDALTNFSPVCRKQLTLPSLRMYEDQSKADGDCADSDDSSCEQTGRESIHSPLGPGSSPQGCNQPSRGRPTAECYPHHGTLILRVCFYYRPRK